MPHSTRAASLSRIPSFKFPNGDTRPTIRTSMEQFPVLDVLDGQSPYLPSPTKLNGYANGGPPPVDRWVPRRDNSAPGRSWANGQASSGGRGHTRQKSLSDAFRTIRTRKGSVSANVHEISDALKAPVSPKLIILCIIWYFSSALTNTSSKAILNAFSKPATLTLIQFGFVAIYCLFFAWLATIFPALRNMIPSLRQGIRYPTREVIMTTLPLAAFQIGGHLLSSTATAKIPVSLVHTIKGLSPLFTVFAYRFIYDIRYPTATYISLIPLTLGVMLACSAEFAGNIFGILYAFLAALIFVTQNIFSKRLFNEAAIAESTGASRKLDKLNLLFYCSFLAFLITSPIWFWTEGIGLLRDFFHDGSLDLNDHPSAFDHGRLALEFVFNGTFHFSQNILAFILLSLVSPVTYSVASLIKRVFVIIIALIWFQNPTTSIQFLGIILTFFGLYLYDRTKENNKADRKAKMMNINEESILPLSNIHPISNLGFTESPVANGNGSFFTSRPTSSYANVPDVNAEAKKSDEPIPGRSRRSRDMSNASSWLPPGTRQEETWRPSEIRDEGVSVS